MKVKAKLAKTKKKTINPDNNWVEVTPDPNFGKPVRYICVEESRIITVDEKYIITKVLSTTDKDKLWIKIEGAKEERQ